MQRMETEIGVGMERKVMRRKERPRGKATQCCRLRSAQMSRSCLWTDRKIVRR